MRISTSHRNRLLFALLAGASGSGALAQEAAAPPAPAPDSLEIVVTAQKRSERLQDVPISVSALAGDQVQKGRMTQADDLVTKVPNLQLSSTVGDNTPIFALRGVSMSDYSLNQAGPVATYYDEVYKGNFAFLGLGLYDMERVEVLRGPQGTLYGKNTTGGAVNLISRRPELDTTSGYLNLGYGNYNRYEANGAINLPITETLAARVAFTFARADGWFKNLYPGNPDLGGTREYGVRASVLWKPAEGVSFLLRASTSLQNPYNYGIYAQPGPDGIGAGVYEAYNDGKSYFRTGLDRRQIESDYDPRRRARTYAVALTSNVELGGGLSLTSVTSWDKGSLGFGEDTDGAPNKTLEVYYGDRASQFAEDLRLTSNWHGPFDFIVGAYFNREKVFNTTDFGMYRDLDANGDGIVNTADCAAALPYACDVINHFHQMKHSYALYTDMHYDLTDRLILRGGLRYTHDDGRQEGLTSQAFGVNGGALVATLIPSTNLAFKSNNVSGKIGLDYKLDRDILFYVNYSRGYRARSFNAQAFFDPSEASIAKAETIDAFEGGAKMQFANRTITVNTAGFYYSYHNQQFINVNPDGTQTLANLDRSRIFGGEAELSVRASRVLTLRGGLGLLSTRIEKGELNDINLAGHKLSNAPALTFNVGLDLTVLDGDYGKFSLHPDISYVSSQYFEVFNEPNLKQHGYALLGLHIDWEKGPFSASIWGKNLSNKFYLTSRVDLVSGFGFDYNHVGAPRTFGGTVGYKF